MSARHVSPVIRSAAFTPLQRAHLLGPPLERNVNLRLDIEAACRPRF
jgi:hypothetical protein